MKKNICLIMLLLLLTQPAHAQWLKNIQDKAAQVLGQKQENSQQSGQPSRPQTPQEQLLEKREKEQEAKRKALETGVLKTYYDKQKKKIKTEQNYHRGTLHGTSKIYYENGKLKSEGRYIKGRKSGVFKIYYENGKLKEEHLYDKGVLMDKRLYDEKGKLLSVVVR